MSQKPALIARCAEVRDPDRYPFALRQPTKSRVARVDKREEDLYEIQPGRFPISHLRTVRRH
jgi:hypothetical protein